MDFRPRFRIPVPVQLCGVVCDDGVELMGLSSARVAEGPTKVVVLYLPGQFDNAYQQRKNHALLIEADANSFGCVLANTRGQDYYGYQRKYPGHWDSDDYMWTLLGSTFERVVDAHYDVTAWLAFINAVAPDAGVVLVGHSHGAIKIANYLLSDASSENFVSGVVLLSPSDDIGAQRAKLGSRYEEALNYAAGQIRSGNPDALMPEWVSSAPLSAGTYHEAYAVSTSPLRTFAFSEPELSPFSRSGGGWRQPTLVVFGDADAATAGVTSERAAQLTAEWLSSTQCDTFIASDANHHYRGAEDLVAKTVTRWIADNVYSESPKTRS